MKKITLNEELTRMQEMMGITHTSRNDKNAIEELSPSDIVNSMREEEETDENTEVLNKFKDQYGKKKGEEVYYATANKQDRDPETFEKNEESAIGSWDLAMEEDAGVPSDTSDKLDYLEDLFSKVYKMGRLEAPIDFKMLAKSTVNDLFGDEEENTDEIPGFEGTSDKLDYLEDLFSKVYKMGRLEAPIDFKMLAKSTVNDLFGDEEENTDEIPGFEGTRDALDDLKLENLDELQKELEEEEGSWMAMRAGKDGPVYENEEMGGNDEVEESTITYYITKNTDKYGDTTYIVMKKYPYKDGYMVDEYNGEQYADRYQAQQVLNYLIRRQEKSSTRMTTGKEGEVYENEEMGEARKLQQETYFETQTGALQSAEEYATHKGYTVNWESINPEHVAYGQTVKYSVELMKDGTPSRKMLQISLYRMESGKYELTNYIN